MRKSMRNFLAQPDAAALPAKQACDLLERLWSHDAQNDFEKLFALMRVPVEPNAA
jgi:hypothetical protein